MFDQIDKAYFLVLFEPYVREFRGRLIPAFRNIKTEADEAEEKFWKNFSGTENTDPSDVVEMARDHGLRIYEGLDFVGQQLIQLGVAGLYHLWERSVKTIIQNKGMAPETKIRKADFPAVLKILVTNGLDFPNFNSYKKMDELRLVTNTVKHGDGRDCDTLFSLRKSLFDHNPGFLLVPQKAYAEDLWLTEEHFDEYAKAVVTFWDEAVPE